MRRSVLTAMILLIGVGSLVAQESMWDREGDLIAEMLRRPAPQEEGKDEDEEAIETDRDSFTPSTLVVGQNVWVVESAYSYIDNRQGRDTNSYPELLARYGISEWLELRLGYNFEIGGAGNDLSSGSEGADEFDDLGGLESEHTFSGGLKCVVTRQGGWRPRSVAILQASAPAGGVNNDSSLTATYALGWQLPNKWLWDSSLRYKTASEFHDHFHVWAPSTVLKMPLGEKWTVHAEYFGLFSHQKEDEFGKHYFSPGAHYLITPDLELGLRFGWGLNADAANYFANAGLGWRF